jgi:hypothetical protein
MRWSGFTGAPGFTNFYFRDFDWDPNPVAADAVDATDRVETFISTIKADLPNVVQLSVDGDCDIIEETTGELLGTLNGVPGAAQSGTAGAGGYAGASGAVVTWRTGGIRNGRRIRGRTFIVPLYSNKYGADGTLDGATVTNLTTAATALSDLTGSPDLGVWARPTGPAATDGVWHVVTSFTVPDLAAVLRSRRD